MPKISEYAYHFSNIKCLSLARNNIGSIENIVYVLSDGLNSLDVSHNKIKILYFSCLGHMNLSKVYLQCHDNPGKQLFGALFSRIGLKESHKSYVEADGKDMQPNFSKCAKFSPGLRDLKLHCGSLNTHIVPNSNVLEAIFRKHPLETPFKIRLG